MSTNRNMQQGQNNSANIMALIQQALSSKNNNGNNLGPSQNQGLSLTNPKMDSNGFDLPFQNNNNGFNLNGMGAGIGQLGTGLAQLFGLGGGKNPAEAAMPYLNNAAGGNKNLQLYNQAGQDILGPWSAQINQLMSDPSGKFNQFGEGFHESPGFQFATDEATKRANQSAAAGGYVGSPAAQTELANTITGFANQDYYNFMDRVLNLYGQGLQGAGNMANTGANAAGQMSAQDFQRAIAQAQLAYSGQANQNQMNPWGDIIGGGLSLASKFIPGF